MNQLLLRDISRTVLRYVIERNQEHLMKIVFFFFWSALWGSNADGRLIIYKRVKWTTQNKSEISRQSNFSAIEEEKKFLGIFFSIFKNDFNPKKYSLFFFF